MVVEFQQKQQKSAEKQERGFFLKRFFTKEETHPYQEARWVKKKAEIPGSDFSRDEVEFPDFYSQNAVNIISSKYFKIQNGRQETSLKELINRVVKTLKRWGEEQNYFASKEEAAVFEEELTHLVLHQKAWFNSPVWFNVGVKNRVQQCSACFILSVEDDMKSILDWFKTEGLIFKNGSGSGINVSTLRGKGEPLSSGGFSSGAISFMKAADAVAGSIKSGGTTRRAAKMVVMDATHPEVMDFIRLKAEEEKKILSFIEAGYDLTDMNHPLWQNIFFQNANNSVRIPDALMKTAARDGIWQTRMVKNGEVAETYKARDVLKEAAQAAWGCGDPGVQFDDIIQRWHTCKNSGRINATNPCAEYIFLDNTSCNLASINLMKFLKDDGQFDIPAFRQAVQVIFLAQDILISKAGYPTERIAEETKKYRTIGLGYANLGALIMALGFPYDSDEARSLAAGITALMTGEAYRLSTEIAERLKPFPEYEKNAAPMIEVMNLHRAEALRIKENPAGGAVVREARKTWDEAVRRGERYGFRNAQATVIAPTGTIGLAMDCDTTGVEPEFSLVKMKQLVGGGWMKFVNGTAPPALKKLGYDENQIKEIVAHLEEKQSIETAPHVKDEHLAVFDCAIAPPDGKRAIHWMGHVRMVAAIQPFISGGISKTFNMPNSATVEDIYDAYFEAWRLGVKCFAVYRDGSKVTQALYNSKGKVKKTKVSKRRLPAVRKSETHKFEIAGHAGYLTYGMYDDGTLGEIFIRMAKQGSTLAGLLDAFAITISVALQHGVPLKDLADKFMHMRFEPLGITDNPKVQFASSIVDYVFKYLAYRFLPESDLVTLGLKREDEIEKTMSLFQKPENGQNNHMNPAGMNLENSGPPCKTCGGMTIRTGSCYTCLECGDTSGGCG